MAKEKKRWVNIPSVGRVRLYTKKIDVDHFCFLTNKQIDVAKVKLHNVWFIFDIESEEVISQGLTWTDCLDMLKSGGLLNQN